MSRLPTYAFGYKFMHLPEFAREVVSSLERERVTYGDRWIEELNDFRHVRTAFTEDEAKDYVRRIWAYELFLRAGSGRLPVSMLTLQKTMTLTLRSLRMGRASNRPTCALLRFEVHSWKQLNAAESLAA